MAEQGARSPLTPEDEALRALVERLAEDQAKYEETLRKRFRETFIRKQASRIFCDKCPVGVGEITMRIHADDCVKAATALADALKL
jgi:hypothetical protein